MAIMVATVSANQFLVDSPINYNVVDTSLTCNEDFDCNW